MSYLIIDKIWKCFAKEKQGCKKSGLLLILVDAVIICSKGLHYHKTFKSTSVSQWSLKIVHVRFGVLLFVTVVVVIKWHLKSMTIKNHK